jgi:hypothetical protein
MTQATATPSCRVTRSSADTRPGAARGGSDGAVPGCPIRRTVLAPLCCRSDWGERGPI